MAPTKLMQAKQLKFLNYRQKSGLAGAEDGRESTYTSQDGYGVVAQGCFSSALKRSLKAFCGRLGKCSIHHKKSSSLFTYLHIHVPLDPHLSPLAFQKPKSKSKSKQSLLDHPVGLHDEHSLMNELPLDPSLPSLAFQKQKSKSKQSQPIDEHSHISEHEEIKGIIHLEPKGTTFASSDGIKGTSLDSLYEETKANDHQPPQNISSIDTLEKSPILVEGFEQLSRGRVVSANQAGYKRQSKVLSGIQELMLGVTQYSLGLEATPHTSFDDDKHISSRSLRLEIPKPNVRPAHPKPTLNVQGSDDLLNRRARISRSTFDGNHMHHPKPHNVDDILLSLAARVFSLRDQMMRGVLGGGDHNYPPWQHGHAIFENCSDNGDAYDVKKPMAGSISARTLEDLADLEEFLQCYMKLYSPCFLDMVNHIFCEICDDIFECEGLDPFIHGA